MENEQTVKNEAKNEETNWGGPADRRLASHPFLLRLSQDSTAFEALWTGEIGRGAKWPAHTCGGLGRARSEETAWQPLCWEKSCMRSHFCSWRTTSVTTATILIPHP